MANEEKNFFEKTLEKKVKGAEKLGESIDLTSSGYSAGVFDWKGNGRYDWKANFPYSPPKEDSRGDFFKRYVAILKIKKYSSL